MDYLVTTPEARLSIVTSHLTNLESQHYQNLVNQIAVSVVNDPERVTALAKEAEALDAAHTAIRPEWERLTAEIKERNAVRPPSGLPEFPSRIGPCPVVEEPAPEQADS